MALNVGRIRRQRSPMEHGTVTTREFTHPDLIVATVLAERMSCFSITGSVRGDYRSRRGYGR
jgi:hypothetical protein